MIDYMQIIERLDEEIHDEADCIAYYAVRESDFQHGMRIGKIIGKTEVRSCLEELRMMEAMKDD